MPGYPQQTATAFERSRACFDQLVAELGSEQASELSHADLEDRLSGQGRELVRLLLQDHLDLRTVREQRQDQVVGADRVARTRMETGHQRQLATVFGPVAVCRMAYRAPGVANLYPADEVLSLPAGKYSHGLGRLVALETTRGSFAAACQAVERVSGVQVGNRQAQELAQATAVDVPAFYAARAPAASPAERLLVLQFDGKGIVMIPAALRAPTAKAAAQAGHKLSTRLSAGEKTGRKRMAELACVFDADPAPRRPTDIIAVPGKAAGPCRQSGPVATGKWLTGSVVDDIGQVIAAGFDEACRRDPHGQRTWVVLVDGNRTQIEAITNEAARRHLSIHIVLDFVHVLEYVWKAAWSLFYPADPAAEAWVADQARKILAGKASQVAAGVRRRATRFGYSPAERAGADACANYLSAHRPYLNYHTALAAGWPIATGAIEGACRHLVKDRMDITGARWGLPTAEAILQLRAVISNGDFDEYWAFHLQQEHQRLHTSRYLQHCDQFTLAA